MRNQFARVVAGFDADGVGIRLARDKGVERNGRFVVRFVIAEAEEIIHK